MSGTYLTGITSAKDNIVYCSIFLNGIIKLKQQFRVEIGLLWFLKNFKHCEYKLEKNNFLSFYAFIKI